MSRYGRFVIDVDARYRLDGDTLRVLDAIYEMAQGAIDVPLSRERVIGASRTEQ